MSILDPRVLIAMVAGLSGQDERVTDGRCRSCGDTGVVPRKWDDPLEPTEDPLQVGGFKTCPTCGGVKKTEQ